MSSAGPEVWDQCVLSVHSGFTGELATELELRQ